MSAEAEERRSILGGEEHFNDDLQEQSAKRLRRDLIITRIIYIVVGLIVLGVIAAVIIILVTTFNGNNRNKTKYSFNSMFNGSLSASSPSLTWSLQQDTYTTWFTDKDLCELRQIDAATQNVKTLVSDAALKQYNIPCYSEYYASTADSLVAFKLNVTKVFRHSVLGQFLVYDTVQNTAVQVSPRTTKQKTLVWCPAGKIAAYVENNNVYLRNFDTQYVWTDLQVTNDGNEDTIFNGVTDWVYEEEVFGAVNALAFSPDCSKLAFLKLDDSNVEFYEYEDYFWDNPYPQKRRIRIPVPGTPNPIPSVHVFDLSTAQTFTVDIGTDTDVYVYDILWANSTTVSTVRLNRLQNKKEMLLAVYNSQGPTVIPSVAITVRESSTWIQYARSAFFIPNSNGRYFVDVFPLSDSYNLALFDVQQEGPSKLVRFVVQGDFNIIDVFRTYNPTTNEIYYSSTETGSTDKHIYAVKLDGSGKRWISSNATLPNGNTQGKGWVEASLSATGSFVVLYYNGPDVPRSELLEVSSLRTISVLSTNDALRAVLKEYDMPRVEIQTIKGAKGDDLNAMIVYPPGFSDGVQYPVLMNVYGGPGASLVQSSFGALYKSFNLYIASLGFIVVTVDGRGTGGKGEKFLTCTYKQLGKLEVEDQVAAAKYLKTLPYVNPSSISIWGWSYGGFMTLSSISSPLNTQVFKLGMAVAPVTDWRYYDSAYTERYMQRPVDNLFGYQNTSVLNMVAPESNPDACNANYPVNNLLPKSGTNSKTQVLIVHGTGDDNVHPLNTFNLMTRLQNCGVQFDVMFYPNKDHSIAGTSTRRHLYRMLSNKLQSVVFGGVTDAQ